jgi:IclR family pca regulon transcriptional regulator
MEHRYFIRSLARGLKVLKTQAQAQEPLTLSNISESLGLTLSTAYRFLYTLEALEFVEKDPEMKSYRISTKMLKLDMVFSIPPIYGRRPITIWLRASG